MKKILMLVCLLLILGGCGKTVQNQQQIKNQENKGVFSSIRDAFDRSLAVKCEFTDESGQKSAYYIKNKMLRTETTQSGKQIYGLFKDNKMYMWQSDSNEGMVFDLDDAGEKTEPGVETAQSVDEVIEGLEIFKDKCRVDNVADSLFTVPGNVNFSNLNDLMKQFGN